MSPPWEPRRDRFCKHPTPVLGRLGPLKTSFWWRLRGTALAPENGQLASVHTRVKVLVKVVEVTCK